MASMGASAPVLHVTNGDSAAGVIRAAGFADPVLPWRDVLHEGPVPAGLSAGEMAAIRALYIAEQGWDAFGALLGSFRRRDERLAALREYSEVVLWFEHDLYDQLQLVQVLDRIAGMDTDATRLTLTSEAAFIGSLPPDRVPRLFDSRGPVTTEVLETGRLAWAALTAPEPEALARLAGGVFAGLPFLGSALTRLLEEYPAPGIGLGRTERQILEVVDAGADTPAAAFAANQAREEALFMGDARFWLRVDGLLRAARPLLRWAEEAPASFPPASGDDRRFFDCRLALTDAGRATLDGGLDAIAVNGIDRWIGGVRLRPGGVWRYDPERRRLIPPA
jgi:hypothetical protein